MFDAFGEAAHLDVGAQLGLGHQYMLSGDQMVALGQAQGGLAPTVTGHANGGGGSPASTLVGKASGLEIDLIWDSSVTSNTHWQAIEQTVVQAAKTYTDLFTNQAVINIDVTLDNLFGQPLPQGALGESATNGFALDYPTLAAYLGAADAGLVQAGVMAPDAVNALQGLSGEAMFVPTAEAKAIGLIDPATPVLDGIIALSSSQLSFFGDAGGGPKTLLADGLGVAQHEISEVLGRIGVEGLPVLDGVTPIYTPLDIFRYSGPGAPDTTPTSGYFSLDDGATALNVFNDPHNGGDAADWAFSQSNLNNAFSAFVPAGVKLHVTADDVLALAALGYQLAPAKA
jgi:hypothetical protein